MLSGARGLKNGRTRRRRRRRARRCNWQCNELHLIERRQIHVEEDAEEEEEMGEDEEEE